MCSLLLGLASNTGIKTTKKIKHDEYIYTWTDCDSLSAVTGLSWFLGYKKTSSASDYLVGGRQMNPFVMALSYGATLYQPLLLSALVG